MKEPNNDATVTITYEKLKDIMAEKATDLAIGFSEVSRNPRMKDIVLELTAMFAAKVVKEVFKEDKADGQV